MSKSSSANPHISSARLAAFEILRRVEEDGAYATTLLASTAEQLESKDRNLTHELVLGVLRRQLWLDRLVSYYSDRDPELLDAAVRIALRLGIYQLRFMSRIPASAAVNESVNLVRFARVKSASPFVNAVLRRATREPEFDPASVVTDPLEQIAVRTSHPKWLIQKWADDWGLSEAERFAAANNQVPPTAFRVINEGNRGREVLGVLESAGATIKDSKIASGARVVSGAGPALLELVGKGLIYLQDEASQLVAHVLGAERGERVLDVCAAPGSKTTHIADLFNDEGLIIAADIYPHRLKTIVAAVKTQGFKSIQCVALDALKELPFETGHFDRVLVDAPCSGTGTLRRNPEIKWRLTRADIQELAERQIRILANAANQVKSGGRLVYSTCSVEVEENEQVVEKFMTQDPRFRPSPLDLDATFLTGANTARIWPHKNGADGFFIASFERR
ncbi:MAG TPA: 16S rRNA (cytosine(967)-C(5))-methyltransferase RsmB [Pyrinomonadaceae bacterium]|nr:16S rRNA (cytosine(967)-C(5))-methyltransferase RsmB [Pyrinomonadaceae bacterium]